MLLNNFKIGWRTLNKHRIYAIISIIGLAFGIAATLLIFRIVNYELGFNKNFTNYDRIGRIVRIDQRADEGLSYTVCVPTPAMDVIDESISQFAEVARIKEMWSSLTVPDPDGGAPLRKFALTESTSFFTEPSFFKIFNLNWIEGDASTALSEPNSIVLSAEMAEKCFDSPSGLIGKTLLIDNLIPVKVMGVYEDLPSNCDFNFPYLVSYPTLVSNPEMFFYAEGWNNCSSNNQLYALLNPMAEIEAANAALAKVGAEEYNGEITTHTRRHVFQPMHMLHYDENFQNSGSHRTLKSRLRILGGIGILILLMACFNFINLATAQSILRSKEVGVRKTLGSRRSQLTAQFMTETGLIVILALGLGVTLASLTSPLLKFVSDVPDELPFLATPIMLLFIICTAIFVTLLSGLYPALALSNYKPIEALNSRTGGRSAGGVGLRKALVVLQFVIAQVLIIAAFINILQLDYVRNKDLGFSKDLVYTFSINVDSLTLTKQNALKSKLLQIPEVEYVSLSSDQPLSGNTWSSNFRYADRPEDEQFSINMKFCDVDYLDTYGLRLKSGRWLQPSDTMKEVVLNQTALIKLGITSADEVIDEKLNTWGRDLRIVGVVEDFHQHNLRSNFQPLMLTTRKDMYWEAGAKLNTRDIVATTGQIQQVFNELLPEQVFDGDFLDEEIQQFYESDQRLSDTTKGFGFLAILISCLGLFGLATHAAAQRVKEIGVRKVLGASTVQIVFLLSKDFLKLVCLALVIATPIAAYFMDKWLDNFVFSIPMPWWVFAVGGIIAILITFITVSYQSVRAAMLNPIESLRDE